MPGKDVIATGCDVHVLWGMRESHSLGSGRKAELYELAMLTGYGSIPLYTCTLVHPGHLYRDRRLR